jgi:hypothetical protein
LRATMLHPLRSARGASKARSEKDRPNLSTRLTMRMEPFPLSRAVMAPLKPGRFSGGTEPLTPSSRNTATRSKPLRAHSARKACSCPISPRPLSFCSSVLTLRYAMTPSPVRVRFRLRRVPRAAFKAAKVGDVEDGGDTEDTEGSRWFDIAPADQLSDSFLYLTTWGYMRLDAANRVLHSPRYPYYPDPYRGNVSL